MFEAADHKTVKRAVILSIDAESGDARAYVYADQRVVAFNRNVYHSPVPAVRDAAVDLVFDVNGNLLLVL